MQPVHRGGMGVLLAIALAASATLVLMGDGGAARAAHSSAYSIHNLVADTDGVADHTDADLVNPWGIAFTATSPFWIADNHTGVSTIYDGTGAKKPLTVTIPPPAGEDTASPTGMVANRIPANFGGDLFIFASEDGIISGWQTGTAAAVRADSSAGGAVYKGLAMARVGGKSYLGATDFHNNRIDVFNSAYQPVNASKLFVDRREPQGYAPFNIATLNGHIFVSYAKQDADAHDDAPGAGNGFIDEFNLNGKLVKRFASGTGVGGRLTALNSPWGMTIAPRKFGKFARALLVGNFGSGQIAALNPHNGRLLGLLSDAQGQPLVIDGLWALTPGGGGNAGDPNKVYFTAGPDDETHGLFGVISVAP